MNKWLFLVMLVFVASMVVPAAPAAAQDDCSYTVKADDTSSAIAAAEGITLGQLVEANPGLQPRWIYIVQILNVCPVKKNIGTTSVTADPGPSPARQLYRETNFWVEANCVAYHLYLNTTICIEWSTGSVVIPYNRE